MSYKRRWQIEVLFEALKSRGFNFEETRLKEAKRLETLCGVLAMVFCWTYRVGAWRHRVKPIALKTHQRPAKSLFRCGFDGIRQAGLNAAGKGKQFDRILDWICFGKRCHCPKRSLSLVTPHDFVVYSEGHVPQDESEAPATVHDGVCWSSQHQAARHGGKNAGHAVGHEGQVTQVHRPDRMRNGHQHLVGAHFASIVEERMLVHEEPMGQKYMRSLPIEMNQRIKTLKALIDKLDQLLHN